MLVFLRSQESAQNLDAIALLHTADYFLFRYGSAGWTECKPAQELHRLAEKQPNRYVLDGDGIWRCPPGETFAKKYGLTYHVWSSDQINWAAQDNALYLEEYYQDLESLTIPQATLETLSRLVDEHPGIMLADLRRVANGISADFINIALAKDALYVGTGRDDRRLYGCVTHLNTDTTSV